MDTKDESKNGSVNNYKLHTAIGIQMSENWTSKYENS